jgi:hypothetical protein
MSVGSTLVRGAEIRFQEATVKLRPFVGCFWVITADRDASSSSSPTGVPQSPLSCRTEEFPPGRLWLTRLLLLIFIPEHISFWDKFPIWYYLTFLTSLVPLALVGGRIAGWGRRPAPRS